MKKKIVVLFAAVLFVFTAAFNVVMAQNQAPEMPDENEILNASEMTSAQKEAFKEATGIDAGTGGAVLISNLNFHDGKIVNQDGNELEFEFMLNNEDFVQPGVVYGVELMKSRADGGRDVVDRKLYDEELSFSVSDKVVKKIKYQAPEFLAGEYMVRLVAYNKEGLLLALWPFEDKVILSGTGKFVSLENCIVTGDDFEFGLGDGVDINPGEEVYVACDAISSFDSQNTFSAKFSTYERTVGSDNFLNSETKGSFEVSSGQGEIKIPITYPNRPQSYDVEIVLVDDSGDRASNMVVAHYVVRGNSATITSLTLDKDAYNAGDLATVSMLVSGRADQFPGSRYDSEEESFDGMLKVSIKNDDGEVCSESETNLSGEDVSGVMKRVEMNIERECVNPHVYIELLGEDGSVLYKTDAEVVTKKDIAEGVAKKRINYLAIIIIIFILIPLIAVGYKMSKKKGFGSRMPMFFLVFMFGVLGFFSQANDADAAVYSLYDGHLTATVNWPATGDYNPGQNVTVSSDQLKVVSCANFVFVDTYLQCTIDGYANTTNLEHISCNYTCGSGICKICADYGLDVATFSIPATCRSNVLQCRVLVYGGSPGSAYQWFANPLGAVSLGSVNCSPQAQINGPASGSSYDFGEPISFDGIGIPSPVGGGIDYYAWIDANPGTPSYNKQTCSGADGDTIAFGGTKTSFELSSLSSGTHRICLAARQTFSDGERKWSGASTDWVDITVNQESQCGPYDIGTMMFTSDTTDWPDGIGLDKFCAAGTMPPPYPPQFPEPGGSTSWQCMGPNLYDSKTCTASREPSTEVVNGSCSSTFNGGTFDNLTASTPGLCSTGNVINFTTTATGWSWNCEGLNGGVTSGLCSATQTVTCDPESYSCNIVGGDPNYCSDISHCEEIHSVTRNCIVTDSCGNVTNENASVCEANGVSCLEVTKEKCPNCPDTTNWIEVTP